MAEIIKKIRIIVVLIILLVLPIDTSAYFGRAQENYPKLVNYFLRWDITDKEATELAKWDVLILDMETANNSPQNLRKLRQLNPNIILLAYITSQEINTKVIGESYAMNRTKLMYKIDESWWLKDKGGNKLSFWPGTNFLNMTDGAGLKNGKRWNDILPEFVRDEIISTRLWDGVFYDNVWKDVAWFNSGNLDINCNGNAPLTAEIDRKWQDGYVKMLKKTQELIGKDYLVVGNSHGFEKYQPYLNGIMLETFPSSWENGGTWAGSMSSYFLDKLFKNPKLMVINSNTENKWQPENYRKMRFSVGSVLLGDGYFSFDYGNQDHAQTWWYDEYEADLGKALGEPYNILDKNNSTFKDGVWRRDFEKGIVVVNSTTDNKNYVFRDEEFSKINGTQDRLINNGAKVNLVSMLGKDAVVLLGTPQQQSTLVESIPGGQGIPVEEGVVIEENKTVEEGAIKEASFNNGGFVRVFDNNGNQTRNGFFSYLDRFPAGSQILISDIDGDRVNEELVNYKGIISIYKNGKLHKSFKPYDGKFKGDISFAVSDLNGDATKEIITGAGQGGGPHVRVFDKDGNPLIGGFFAYDKDFRGGVDIAVMDLNGDDTKEIITGAGPGGGAHVRIFTKDGYPLTSGFFAYSKDFRGGVSISVGNVDGGGDSEIITGPGPGGGPEVKIFSKDGRLIRSFFAYDKNDRSGVKVMASDSDNNGIDEIFVNNLGY